MTAPINNPRNPPYKLAGLVLLLVTLAVVVLVWFQFRGDFRDTTTLTLKAGRAGLVMDPGSKVTFNGVVIGKVADVLPEQVDGKPGAELKLEVDPKYIELIPENVDADIKATTVFGNKYVSFTSPEEAAGPRVSSSTDLRVRSVTTEFNTLFETVVDVSAQVDPIKLNATLTATAQALDGLGERFGASIENGNRILDDLNPKMPQLRYDTQRLADLTEVYADSAPELFDALQNAVITAATLNEQQGNLDAALMASIGFGNTGADVFERSGPYLIRGAEDLLPTSQLLDEYSPALFCTIRKMHDVGPKVAETFGGNGYSLKTHSQVLGASNAYVYPDNLPRVNAKGGPEGKPGCWQDVSRDLWPAPYLVMDTGASIAPYNHIELASPFGCAGLPPCLAPIPLIFPGIEYVWGRQLGENTINP